MISGKNNGGKVKYFASILIISALLFTAGMANAASVTLNWDHGNLPGIVATKIYATNTSTFGIAIATVSPASVTTYTTGQLAPGKWEFYVSDSDGTTEVPSNHVTVNINPNAPSLAVPIINP